MLITSKLTDTYPFPPPFLPPPFPRSLLLFHTHPLVYYKRHRLILRMFLLLHTVSAYGQEWEKAEVHSVKTPYKTFFNKEIIADIGVKIGLNSVNITLKGD